MPEPSSKPASILVVDDDPGIVLSLHHALESTGKVLFATNGRDALRIFADQAPDLVLLDAEMPGMSGFDVCRTIRQGEVRDDVPIIFVTSHNSPEFEVLAFDSGASDFVSKPLNPRVVQARTTTHLKLYQATQQLHELASHDPLTQLRNRRGFDTALDVEWRRARRSGTPLALLLADIDHFKRFNDHYGHPAGDQCLRRVARALAACAKRPGDLAARWGGEEFAILLPETDNAGAASMAEKVVDAVRELRMAHARSDRGIVTLSVGFCAYDQDSTLWSEGGTESRFGGLLVDTPSQPMDAGLLVQAADAALYRAKHAGRDGWADADLAMNLTDGG